MFVWLVIVVYVYVDKNIGKIIFKKFWVVVDVGIIIYFDGVMV